MSILFLVLGVVVAVVGGMFSFFCYDALNRSSSLSMSAAVLSLILAVTLFQLAGHGEMSFVKSLLFWLASFAIGGLATVLLKKLVFI